MTKNSRLLLCAVALCAPAVLYAQPADPPPIVKGQLVILDKDRILQGDIERIGNQFRIRRSIGETLVPADKVRHLCDSLEEGYAYLRSQANLNDGDERIRLSRWCHLHGLHHQAIEEAAAAVKLRPDHPESQRLLRGLQRTTPGADAQPTAPKEEPEVAALPNLPCNTAALGLFVTRVQPILMNTCARCHAAGKGSSFKLVRGYDDGGLPNRRTTQSNLTAALTQLNRARISESPLLSYAVTMHGDTDHPPLQGRTAAAFKTLEEWVNLAMVDVPRSSPEAVIPLVAETKPVLEAAPPKPLPEAKPVVEAAPPRPLPVPVSTNATELKQVPNAARVPEPAPAKAAPAETFAQPKSVDSGSIEVKSSGPVDPFDPAIFNRQVHPGK